MQKWKDIFKKGKGIVHQRKDWNQKLVVYYRKGIIRHSPNFIWQFMMDILIVSHQLLPR